jgi:quercetin dioxygenase-like cupin family protein
MSYQHVSWKSIPTEALAPGIRRRMVVGNALMICRLQFDPHVVTPVHRHPHEQMTIVECGKARFTIENETRVAGPGDVLHFPSNTLHGATMLDEDVVLVDIFTPIREDFLPAKT